MNTNFIFKDETNKTSIKPLRFDGIYLKYIILVYTYQNISKPELKENEQTMNKVRSLLRMDSAKKTKIFSFVFKHALKSFAREENKELKAMFDFFVWEPLPIEHYKKLSELHKNKKGDLQSKIPISKPIIHNILLNNPSFMNRVNGNLTREDNFFAQANGFQRLNIKEKEITSLIEQDYFYYKNSLPNGIVDMFKQGAPKNYNPDLICDAELNENSNTKYLMPITIKGEFNPNLISDAKFNENDITKYLAPMRIID